MWDQLNRIITEQKDCFHAEKTDFLPAGIAPSSYLHVDDAGVRHAGINGYCTHLGNEQFACFESTSSKNRINFPELLRGPNLDYMVNQSALEYMHHQGLPTEPLLALRQGVEQFPDEMAWSTQLKALGISQTGHRRIATEGALSAP